MKARIAAKLEIIAAAEALSADSANMRTVENVGTVAIRLPLLRRLQIALDAYHQLQEP